MNEKSEFAHIFKALTADKALELLIIVIMAAVLILAAQRLLPLLAGRLHGKKRLTMLSVIPLVRLVVMVTAFVLIVPLMIETSLQNMVALLGALGLALGFALKDYASSLIAGIVVIAESPYRNGDWIEMDGIYGEVCDVGMRSVKLVTPDDNRVTIPHARLWTEAISNANNGTPRMQCSADFYLHPQHDASLAQQILKDVALTSPYLYMDDPISVTVSEKPWGTHYRLKAYPIESAQQFRFISDLTIRGKSALIGSGVRFISIPPIPGIE